MPYPAEESGPLSDPAESAPGLLPVSESRKPDENPGSAPASNAFRYRMTAPTPLPGERILIYRPESRAVPLEKPVIRPVVKTGVRPVADKRQGRLRLDRTSEKPGLVPRSEPDRTEGVERTVFPEILFSRMLSGLIDLVTAVAVGGSTVMVASLGNGSGVLSETLLRDTLATAGAFFFFSTTLLLYLSGQTLGMLATELWLVAEDQNRPRLSDIVLRVLSFLVVTASLLGLIWALFDARQLCWHDHLSKTRVVPVKHGTG